MAKDAEMDAAIERAMDQMNHIQERITEALLFGAPAEPVDLSFALVSRLVTAAADKPNSDDTPASSISARSPR